MGGRYWLWLAVAIGLAALPALSVGEVPKAEGPFTSSQVCGACHLDIYNAWKNSLHAGSLSDPIFEVAFMQAYKESRGAVAPLCLRCHAPTTQVTRDYSFQLKITSEGITCDFCHSVAGMNPGEPSRPFIVKPGPVKRGPWKDVAPKGHEAEYSPLFEQSQFCAGCHEYRNERGAPILSTFTEWSESPYAVEGKECQYCHMPRVKGAVVRAGVSPQAREYVNLHQISGGSSVEQLRRAVKVQIEEIKWLSEGLQVRTAVTNLGAGHMAPTGLPTKKMVLKVHVETPRKEVTTKESVYQKVLADNQGREVTQDSRIFTDPVRVIRDSRLAPRETRKESFLFPIKRQRGVKVRAELRYSYFPLLLQPTDLVVEMGVEERLAP